MNRKPWSLFALLFSLLAPGARAQWPFPNVSSVLAAAPAAPPTPSASIGDYASDRAHLFRDFFRAHPRDIWDSSVPAATRQAVTDYQSRKMLPWPALMTYGQSVRHLDLFLKSAAEIDAALRAKAFQRFDDWIRDPKTKLPKPGKDGALMPMIVYVHPDGGMIRVKPKGDSTNRFRPQPDVVIAVRYPHDADYRDFDKEGFKTDTAGDALPKWPRDLFNPFKGTPQEAAYADGWGDATHIAIKQ